MNTGNFLGISQDYGLRDAFLRLKRWAFFFRPAGLGHEKAFCSQRLVS